MRPWTDEDWARLRTLEGLGLVLVATCAPDHAREWAGCGSPGKVPIDLATGRHMRDWTGRRGTVDGVDLDALRRVQEARARYGLAPYGIGAVTGRRLVDGRCLVALDVDGERGVAEAQRLLGGSRALTLTYRTGGGGWRLLYGAKEPPPNRGDDGGHQGLALCSDGRHVVLPPSGHASGGRYRWAGPMVEIADLPESLRAWAEERPSVAAAHTTVIPAAPARAAAEVDRDLRLYGVPESLRRALAAPYSGPDRSGYWWALTQRLLAYHVPNELIAEASRVGEWGYGAAYRDPGRGEKWLAATLGRAHAQRQLEVDRFLSRGRGADLEAGA
jgi:hypothetical protein